MSAVAEKPLVLSFDISKVQTYVAESTKKVSISMMQALIGAHQQSLTPKALAENKIIPNFSEELAACSSKVQRVYHKLFAASLEHINTHSAQFLGTILNAIKIEISDGDRQFLAAFVLPETKLLVDLLEREIPAALEVTEIWA